MSARWAALSRVADHQVLRPSVCCRSGIAGPASHYSARGYTPGTGTLARHLAIDWRAGNALRPTGAMPG
jgi:hypothetical protein